MSRILSVFVAVLPKSFQRTDFRTYKFMSQQNNSVPATKPEMLSPALGLLTQWGKTASPLPRVVLRSAQALSCVMCTPPMQTSCTHSIKIK